MKIEFLETKNGWRVEQEVGYISSDVFEGTFDEVMRKLSVEKNNYSVDGVYYVNSPKSSSKKFSFESFFIDRRLIPYEDTDECAYYIIGVRDPDEEELAALKKEKEDSQKHSKEVRREAFERLKKEFMSTVEDQEIIHP